MRPEQDPYFGDEQTRLLQSRRDEQIQEMMSTPGAVGHARVFTSDDPDVLGWDRIREVIEIEGLVSLRGVNENKVREAQEKLADFDVVAHHWDIFFGDAEDVRAACTPLANQGLPAGITRQSDETIDANSLHEMQAFLSSHGVSPFSKTALSGALFPGKPIILRKPDGGVAAVAFAGLTHNEHSWLSGVAWVGLVAVDPTMRGLGLGKAVDAIANLVAIDELGAQGTTEFVAADNAPSRAVLMACGLRDLPERDAIIFSQTQDRITR